MAKKTAPLSPELVATKGQAAVGKDATTRQLGAGEESSAPLNFKVSPEFRRRFRTLAAERDLKLKDLLYQCLEAFEEKHASR